VVMVSPTGKIFKGSAVTGTGVPANTIITGQQSGTPSGNGVYTTNNVTTLAGVAINIIPPPAAIDPGGNSPPIVVNPATVIPGEPREKQNAGHDYVLALPTFRGPPLIPVGTTFNTSAVPPYSGTQPPANNAHPLPSLLVFNRTPPFPAYPT